MILMLINEHYVLADSVVATIMISGPPYGLTVNPKTNKIYVPVLSLAKSENEIQASGSREEIIVIDGSSDSVSLTRTVQPIIMSQDVGLAINPETNILYVSDQIQNRILVINADNFQNSVIETVTGLNFDSTTLTGTSASVNSKTNKVYFIDNSSSLAHSLHTIDGSNNMLSFLPISIGYPQGLVIDEEKNKIFVSKRESSTVAVIDGGTSMESAIIFTVGENPKKIAVNPKTNKIYVTDESKNSLIVIDELTNEIVGNIKVGNSPFGVAVNPNTNKIYVTNSDSNNVSVIDGGTNLVIEAINTDPNPRSVVVNTASNKIYIANFGSKNTITVLDGLALATGSTNNNPTSSEGSASPTPTPVIFTGGTKPGVMALPQDIKVLLNDFDDNLIVLGQASTQANVIIQKIRGSIQIIKTAIFQTPELCKKSILSSINKINSRLQQLESDPVKVV